MEWVRERTMLDQLSLSHSNLSHYTYHISLPKSLFVRLDTNAHKCEYQETPLLQGTAVQIGSQQIVIMGGETTASEGGTMPLNSVECIDVTNGVVTALPSLPSPVIGSPSAALLGDNIFLMGGRIPLIIC